MGACCSCNSLPEKSGELGSRSPQETPRPIENQDNKFDAAMLESVKANAARFEAAKANAAILKAKIAKASSYQAVR